MSDKFKEFNVTISFWSSCNETSELFIDAVIVFQTLFILSAIVVKITNVSLVSLNIVVLNQLNVTLPATKLVAVTISNRFSGAIIVPLYIETSKSSFDVAPVQDASKFTVIESAVISEAAPACISNWRASTSLVHLISFVFTNGTFEIVAEEFVIVCVAQVNVRGAISVTIFEVLLYSILRLLNVLLLRGSLSKLKLIVLLSVKLSRVSALNVIILVPTGNCSSNRTSLKSKLVSVVSAQKGDAKS